MEFGHWRVSPELAKVSCTREGAVALRPSVSCIGQSVTPTLGRTRYRGVTLSARGFDEQGLLLE
jgi:hypothetical protein